MTPIEYSDTVLDGCLGAGKGKSGVWNDWLSESVTSATRNETDGQVRISERGLAKR